MRALVFTILMLSAAAALATEYVNYSYDARGRVKQVVRTGSVNNKTTNYVYDHAHNRTSKSTTSP